MSTQRFAVFHNGSMWTAYTVWLNTAWSGFVGWFEGTGDTRKRRMADAIRKAKAQESSAAGKEQSDGK